MSNRKAHTFKKTVAIIFRILLFVVMSCIIGYNLYIFNSKKLVGDALPMPFGYGCAVVLSGSMEPELSVDDLVIIKQTDEFNINDIVVYQTGRTLVIHRVIALEGDTVITKGDANNVEDSAITRDMVKGVLVTSLSNSGTVIRLIQSPPVVITLVVLLFVLLELGYRKQRKAADDETERIKAEIRKLRETNKKYDTSFFVEDLKSDIERIGSNYNTESIGDTDENRE